jgi:hypothetical protein
VGENIHIDQSLPDRSKKKKDKTYKQTINKHQVAQDIMGKLTKKLFLVTITRLRTNTTHR